MSPHRLPFAPLPLKCHSATACAVPLTLSVSLAAAGSQASPSLLLQYELQGDVSRLRLPAPTRPGPADGLWQHCCFEAFLGVAGGLAYREFNFSPSGQWAAYRFHDQRQRDPAAEAATSHFEPGIKLNVTDTGLSLLAWLPLHALPVPLPGQAWDLGLSAVIETLDGQLSYWALGHPGERPDFHHRGGWQTLPTLSAFFLPASATP